jgi:hypothetical protein
LQYSVEQPAFEDSRDSSSLTNEFSGDGSGKDAGENTAPARVGSPGAQDELASVVDLGSGAGAAGFVGKVSEVSWIQRCREILFRQNSGGIEISQRDLDLHLIRAQHLNYHMDDFELLAVDEESLGALYRPPLKTAVELSEAYFDSLHNIFPFVNADQYREIILQYFQQSPSALWDERRWLATANVIFGLGSKWLHLAAPEGEYREEDHLTYYARARALGLDHRLPFDHPTLEQVQALGVLALYLFVNNSIARFVVCCLFCPHPRQLTFVRSWTILGHAIRHATALGLQLRVTAGSIRDSEKATRSRTWYALYALEITLAEYTGRPCSITTLDISVPIDALHESVTLSPDQQTEFLVDGVDPSVSNPTRIPGSPMSDKYPSHFSCRVRLSFLSHRIYSSLYSVGGDMTWSDVQDAVKQFNIELMHWQSMLPLELTVLRTQQPIRSSDPGIELAMYYWSVRMILHRPCLCNLEGRIANESRASRDFNLEAAVGCVDAALALLRLMPDSPNIREAYRILPWWSLLHYVCQASAVLILELCLAAQHCPSRVGEILDGLKKAISYLRMMSRASLSAYKAWRVCRQLMADSTSRLGIDTMDVPSDMPPPRWWTGAYEASLIQALDDRQDSLFPGPSSYW